MQRYDVVVVGAGLAGLWCARAVARRGSSVLLVDAKSSVDARVTTTGIFVRRTFEEFALPAGCLGLPIRRVVLYSPRRRPLVLDSVHDEFRLCDMRALYRALLDDCVGAGVSYMPNTRYCGLQPDGAATVVRLQTMETSRRSNKFDRSIPVNLIAGADGARSQVARDLGLSRNDEFIVGVESIYERRGERAQPALHCFLDPALAPGYLGWIADDGHEVHVGIGGDPKRFDPNRALRRFTRSIQPILDVSALEQVEERGGAIPVNGTLARLANERGLLIGDAAGAVSPLTAGGLDGCLRLSEYAAATIALKLGAPRTSLPRLYNGRKFSARFATRRWIRALYAGAQAKHIEAACGLLHAWPFRAFAEHMFFGRGSFPDLPVACELQFGVSSTGP